MLKALPAAFHRRTTAIIAVLSCSAGIALLPQTAYCELLSLDSCVVRALQSHPALRASDRGIDAARARLSQAGSFDAPDLSYAFGKLGTPVSRDEHESSLRLSQNLGTPGQRSKTKSVARLGVSIAQTFRKSEELRLRAEVARAYRRLQADEAGVRILGNLARTAHDLDAMVATRLRTGGARYLDVLRARSERVRIENDGVEAQRALREDRRVLNSLMGRAPDEPLAASDSLAYVPLSDSLDAVLELALSTRPRVLAARLNVERGRADLALVRGGLLPAASLSAGLDRVPGSDRPGIGGEVSISLPFAPWSDRRSKVREVSANSVESQARLEVTQRDVELAIRNAYGDARAAETQVQQFDRYLIADAADAIRTAIQNYQAGQIDGLELFETLRTFRAIQLEHVRALLNYQLALTDLAVAE